MRRSTTLREGAAAHGLRSYDWPLDRELAALLGEDDPQEVVNLKWEDVDLDEGVIRFRSAAGAGPRHVAPLTSEVAESIAQLRPAYAEGTVFPGSAER